MDVYIHNIQYKMYAFLMDMLRYSECFDVVSNDAGWNGKFENPLTRHHILPQWSFGGFVSLSLYSTTEHIK